MCLLESLRHISHEQGFSIAVAHFNHGLRGEESDRDEYFVKCYCEDCGVQFYSGDGDVKLYAMQNKLSIETAARDMRYSFFFDLAQTLGATRIATAHNSDDNTETMLINFTRGTGATGLGGIPPVRGMIIRPMLRISRNEVIEFLNERDIPYVEDSTNSLDIYTRNKIRLQVVPILKEINPRLNETASSVSELLRADEELLSELADAFIRDNCADQTADARGILNLPLAVSSRVIRKLYSGNLSYKHVKSVLELCGNPRPSAKVSLPNMTVLRDYDRIVFQSKQQTSTGGFAQIFVDDVDSGDSVVIHNAGLKMTCKVSIFGEDAVKVNKIFTSFLFKRLDICGKIAVRSRREGDSIKLFGHNGTKTLKKLFIERRIPARNRLLVPVITDEKGVLAVYGVGVGSRAIPEPGDEVLQIDFEEI